MYRRISGLGMGPYPPRVALDLPTPNLCFRTVRGGIDPGDRRFRPRFVGVVDICKDSHPRLGPLIR